MCAMYRILVNTEYLKQLGALLWSYTEQLRTLETRLNQSFAGIEWEGPDRAAIESQVAQLHSQGVALMAQTEKMARLVSTKNQGFEEEDRQSAASLFPGSTQTPPAPEAAQRTRINLNTMLKKPGDAAGPATDGVAEAAARPLEIPAAVDVSAPQTDFAAKFQTQLDQLVVQPSSADAGQTDQAASEPTDLAQALTSRLSLSQDAAPADSQPATGTEPPGATTASVDLNSALTFGATPQPEQPAQDASTADAASATLPPTTFNLDLGAVAEQSTSQPETPPDTGATTPTLSGDLGLGSVEPDSSTTSDDEPR